jgi:hypothetical protein
MHYSHNIVVLYGSARLADRPHSEEALQVFENALEISCRTIATF